VFMYSIGMITTSSAPRSMTTYSSSVFSSLISARPPQIELSPMAACVSWLSALAAVSDSYRLVLDYHMYTVYFRRCLEISRTSSTCI